MKKIYSKLILISIISVQMAIAAPKEALTSNESALDRSIQLVNEDEVISSVFKDVVVVQRRAKKKAGKFLFNTGLSLDMADSPITMWAVNTNIGYAFSNFFELYINYVPAFIVNERPIVNEVRRFRDSNGSRAELLYSKPVTSYGLDFLWLPAYGKDSFGPYSIVRSDSFFKLTAAAIKFESGESGSKTALLVGKTYFLNEYFNMRIAGGFAQIQAILYGQSTISTVGLFEGGLVFYF